MNMRLDKYLSDYTELTRSEAKRAVRSGRVLVNGVVQRKGEDKVEMTDTVCLDGREIKGQQYQYIMLNKKSGLVSATSDGKDETVIEYIRRQLPSCGETQGLEMPFLAKDLFPMGRLDKDTEGLLVLTNDGELAHRLLSPKNHVDKKYFVRLDSCVGETDVEKMREGLEIGERHKTRPATMEILSERECTLTITEGKFHQIKRMFAALGKKVVYLKRVQMGGLRLDEGLETGGWRFLTEEEIRSLKAERFE